MNKRIVLIAILQLLFTPLAPVCQTPAGKDEWPCKNPPNLLLNAEGKPVWLSTKQLEKRAIIKPELIMPSPGCIWRDVIITVDVIVSEKGKVICTKFKKGIHPILLVAAQMSAEKWMFKPTINDGKPIAVCGQLKFFLKQNSGLGRSSKKLPPLIY